jgi:hypothetical protein
MSRIDLDISKWPVPVITPEGLVSDEELSEFFENYSRMLQQRREPYALIVDLRRASDMPAKQRKTLTDYMKRQEHVLGMYCAGTALIFESSVMRAILTAIFWIRKPPQEVRVFANVQEADLWARASLARRRQAA